MRNTAINPIKTLQETHSNVVFPYDKPAILHIKINQSTPPGKNNLPATSEKSPTTTNKQAVIK